jgi:hypothetical protein
VWINDRHNAAQQITAVFCQERCGGLQLDALYKLGIGIESVFLDVAGFSGGGDLENVG